MLWGRPHGIGASGTPGHSSPGSQRPFSFYRSPFQKIDANSVQVGAVNPNTLICKKITGLFCDVILPASLCHKLFYDKKVVSSESKSQMVPTPATAGILQLSFRGKPPPGPLLAPRGRTELSPAVRRACPAQTLPVASSCQLVPHLFNVTLAFLNLHHFQSFHWRPRETRGLPWIHVEAGEAGNWGLARGSHVPGGEGRKLAQTLVPSPAHAADSQASRPPHAAQPQPVHHEAPPPPRFPNRHRSRTYFLLFLRTPKRQLRTRDRGSFTPKRKRGYVFPG